MYDTIWKFKIKATDRQTIEIPMIYSVLGAGIDLDGDMVIWAFVDTKRQKFDLEILVLSTGGPVPHVGDFIGTVRDGPFAWHVFTGPSNSANRTQNLSYHYQTIGRT